MTDDIKDHADFTVKDKDGRPLYDIPQTTELVRCAT